MAVRRVLVSGASIAGPALARWLGRNGYDVTIVEKAPEIRPGGQAVDFKGRTHHDVLTRMGVLDDVHAEQTAKTEWRMVDAHDRVNAVIPGEFIGGDVEILRGNLAGILHRHSAADAKYVFDDEIVAMTESDTGIDITLARRGSESFDLVLGADGVHSAVRRLALGPGKDLIRSDGYAYAVRGRPGPLGNLHTQRTAGRGIDYGYITPDRLALQGGRKAQQRYVLRDERWD